MNDKGWIDELSINKVDFMEKIASDVCGKDKKCLESENKEVIEQLLIEECKFMLRDLLRLEQLTLTPTHIKEINELIEWDPVSAFFALRSRVYASPKPIKTYIRQRLSNKESGHIHKQFKKGLDDHSYKKMLDLGIITEEKLERIYLTSKEELERLHWDEGLTLEEIGNIFHVSRTTVLKRMKELGIKRRRGGRR